MSGIAGTIYEMLKESRYTVVLSGRAMLEESGYPVVRDGGESYAIEEKYGYSAEEIFSSSFFSTRKQQFYDFYRNELLQAVDIPPGKGYYEMARLEESGIFQTIITRRLFHLPSRAGCRNVIELHGSIFRNYCPHCGREYPIEYIRNTDKIPLCQSCGQAVRPDVILFGEMVDNQVITRAATEMQKADVLLVLGTNLKSFLCSQLTGYYEGNKLIVIDGEDHFSNAGADIFWQSRVDDALAEIITEMEKDRK